MGSYSHCRTASIAAWSRRGMERRTLTVSARRYPWWLRTMTSSLHTGLSGDFGIGRIHPLEAWEARSPPTARTGASTSPTTPPRMPPTTRRALHRPPRLPRRLPLRLQYRCPSIPLRRFPREFQRAPQAVLVRRLFLPGPV